MKHPGEIQLALFAGGDLGFVERRRVLKHVRTCEDCRSGVEALRNGTESLRSLANEMPDGVNWTQVGGPQTVVMPSTVYAGLAASRDSAAPESPSIAFDSVAVVKAAPDFTLRLAPDSQAIQPGGSTSYSATVTPSAARRSPAVWFV